MSKAKIEKTMDEYFVKKAPFQIPANGRKTLVDWLPWISLIFGILGLLAAWGLWQSGHRVGELVNYVNTLAETYGGEKVNSLGATYYLALAALVAQSALMLAAFPGLKERSKSRGWNILLVGTLLNFVYGLFIAFTNYGSLGNLIGSVIGVVIGLYVLAQIKSHYK